MQALDIRTIIKNKVHGCAFAGLDTITVPVLLGGKKNDQQGRVLKRMIGAQVMLFSNKNSNAYENKVKRHLEQVNLDPESFVLSPRSWGRRLENEPVVEHKGAYYLEVIFLNAGPVHYYLDGARCNKQEIIGLPDKDEAEQGGLPEDRKVIIRTFKFHSIEAIRIDGKVFESPRIVMPAEFI